MILVNGKRTGRVSALDRGLAYGDGVFRTMRAESGIVPHWSRHYRKLAVDCARLGIDCPTEEAFTRDIAHLLRVEPDCIVKLIVTRGEGGRGYAMPQACDSVRIAASFAPAEPAYERDDIGVAVRWCATRLATQPALAGIKHLNRLENVLARSEWKGTEFAEGIMLDQGGTVIEGTMSNLFVLEQGRLVTPPVDHAGVAGVQRDRLLEFSSRLSLACVVDALSPERLMAAQQVYLTNSVIGLWWVSALETKRWTRCDLTVELTRLLREHGE